MLLYRAAPPLSHQTLTYLPDLLRRHRKQTGSPWRKLDPGQQALLVQVIASPDGTILWVSGQLPGSTRDTAAARSGTSSPRCATPG